MNKANKEKELLRVLNSKIDIYGNVKKTNKLNEIYNDEDIIDSMWAEIIPQTGSIINRSSDTMFANVTHKIKVRYQAGKNIKEDNYIICRGKRYNIKFILNVYNRNEWLEMFCEEIIE